MDANGIVVASSQQSHAKGVAQPVTGLADTDGHGRVWDADICLWNHANPPTSGALVADLRSTIAAVVSPALGLVIERHVAADAASGVFHHFGR